jgi:hypothetical protein
MRRIGRIAKRSNLRAAVHGAAVIALRKGLPADTDRDQLAAAALDAALYGLTCVSTRTLYAGMQASSVSVGLSA